MADDRLIGDNETAILALLQAFTSFFTNVKQSERNIIQVNGNNNTIQIPNEEGPGSNIQGSGNDLSGGGE